MKCSLPNMMTIVQSLELISDVIKHVLEFEESGSTKDGKNHPTTDLNQEITSIAMVQDTKPQTMSMAVMMCQVFAGNETNLIL